MKTKTTIVLGILIVLIIMVSLYLIVNFNDDGEYDYCIEWKGLEDGTLTRSNLLFTCYNLATSTFYCDYEINKDTQVLMIKPIVNVTKNEGVITEIIYSEPNYFDCIKWLKSKEVEK